MGIHQQNSSTRATEIVTISIKILEVNFGKSIVDNAKWDKIIEGQQKTHVWNRERLSLKGKNVMRNQILVSKL